LRAGENRSNLHVRNKYPLSAHSKASFFRQRSMIGSFLAIADFLVYSAQICCSENKN